jgi:hypothetical protein
VNTQVKQIYTLRGLLDFKARTPVPIEEVEIHREHHEALQNRRDELRLHLQRSA